jgi:hypothetical protein
MAKKVKGFEDFQREGEKENLKKIKRSFKPNSDQQQFTTKTRNEFDEDTRKITAVTKDEVKDKLDAIENIEEGLGAPHGFLPDDFGDEESPIKVKHLIAYLQKLDPEAGVELDKDGWEHEEDPIETIENSGLFDIFDGTLFINN